MQIRAAKELRDTHLHSSVAILELKNGGTAGPRKSRGANINVYLAW